MIDTLIPQDTLDKIKILSPRRMEIFLAIGDGLTRKEIAAIKGKLCAIKTVESLISQTSKELDMNNFQLRELAIKFKLYLQLNNLKIDTKKETTVRKYKYRDFIKA